MAKVITTISLKGGVGKTTVTAALAEFMASEFGKRVLLVDLDSQINLTTMLIGEDRWIELNERKLTIATLFADAVNGTSHFDLHATIQKGASNVKKISNVDLLPSSLDLIELQEQLSALRVREGSKTSGVGILGAALEPVKDFYDFILVDCPPNVGPVTLNGLAMADGYIIPTIPDFLSTYGIPQIQKYVKNFSAELGRTVVELGLVITKHKSNSSVHTTVLRNLRRNGSIQHVLPPYLPEANSIALAADFQSFGTLRVKYGNQGQYDKLKELTRTILTEAQTKL